MLDSLNRSITRVKWADSHDAVGQFLGAGGLYYGLIYALAARRCVCLGSGGGFVPMMMVAAQRQLVADGVLRAVDVTLVDGNVGPWGRPDYDLGGISRYPEIKIVVSLTHDAADQFADIDYLHVDADHSYEGALADFQDYGSRMRGNHWVITVHDTCNAYKGLPVIGAYRAAREWATANGHEMVTFDIGEGVSVIAPRKGFS
jgi:hypothetical protein